MMSDSTTHDPARPLATARPVSLGVRVVLGVLLALSLVVVGVGRAEAGPRIVDDGDPSASDGDAADDADGADGVETRGVAVIVHERRRGRRAVRSRAERYAGRPWIFDIGLTLSWFGFEDYVDVDEWGESGGIGLMMRWRFARKWALVLDGSIAYRESETTDLRETKATKSLGVAFFPFYGDHWGAFASLGFTATGTFLYTDGERPEGRWRWRRRDHHDGQNYLELGGYAGLGAEAIWDWAHVVAEARWVGLVRTDGDEVEAMQTSRGDTRRAPTERWGVLLQLGILWGF